MKAVNTTNIRLKLDIWLIHPLLYTWVGNLLPRWLNWRLYQLCVRAALSESEEVA